MRVAAEGYDVRRFRASGKGVLDDGAKHSIQFAILSLMFDLGALRKYKGFTVSRLEIRGKFASYMSKIKQIEESGTILYGRVTISGSGKVFISLLKKTFVVDVLSGRIDDFLLRCEHRFARFEYQINTQYDILPAFRRCEIQLNGEPETLVSVLQQ